jgi:hypothetical protein
MRKDYYCGPCGIWFAGLYDHDLSKAHCQIMMDLCLKEEIPGPAP